MGLINSTPSIEQVLHKFSNSLIPNKEYCHKGNQVAREVFNFIRKHHRDLGRCLVAGGIGKGTAIYKSDDYELVVFLNNKKPPFQNVLCEMEDLLETKYDSVRVINETTIRFYSNYIKFDLSIGMNLQGCFSNQREGTISKIKATKNPLRQGHIFSPCLAEYYVKYMKDCSPFTRQVIRIAKFWNSHIQLDDYLSGRSLLIEMVAIQAARDVGKADIFLVVKQFLQLMANFNNLTVCSRNFYQYNKIPKVILHSKPYVMDPVNPYNNLADISDCQMDRFSTSAERTLEKLSMWKKGIFGNLVDNRSVAYIFEYFY